MHGRSEALLTNAELATRRDFRLGELLVSPSARTVRGPGGSDTIEPRVMQVLIVLADAAGKVVTRDTLLQRCWGSVYVGDDSLNRAIGGVRRIASRMGAGVRGRNDPAHRLSPDRELARRRDRHRPIGAERRCGSGIGRCA